MSNGVFRVPPPVNEPVLAYAPESPERARLQAVLATMRGERADIPLWIGGGGEKRTLRAVARYANGWNYFMTTPEEYRQKLDALEGHCRDWGRDPASIRKQLITWAILDQDTEPPNERFFVGSSEQFVERLKPYLDMGVQDVLLLQRSLDAQTLESFAGKVAGKLR